MENDKKLSWVALRGEVARRAGVSDKTAKLFLDALVEQMTQALEQHESIRINGLGIFKTQETAPRKSVDVRTGEAITISAYHKLVFSSDASLKKDISFENPVVASDSGPMRRLSEQADEIVSILADMGQTTEEEETQEVIEEETQEVIEEETQEVVEEETPETVEEETLEVVEEETPPITESTPIVEPTSIVEPASTINSTSSSFTYNYTPTTNQEDAGKKPKKKKTWLIVGIILVVLCALLIAAYFVLQYKYSDILDKLREKTEAEQVLADDNSQSEDEGDVAEWEGIKLKNGEMANEGAVEDETVAGMNDVQEPAVQPYEKQKEPGQKQEETPEKESVLTAPRSYKELITTEEMRPNSRLTRIAERHYGHKELWVFIYEANLGKLKSPTNIEAGTPIRVPKLSEQLMDVDNPETKELIRQLSEQYLKR
ncbi:MAG: HU family DNA-binding protein [Paludibacteraceae bacterium]|nr:HU family DNA-binding protein [Paludibacteraceae bacterium]